MDNAINANASLPIEVIAEFEAASIGMQYSDST